MARLVTGAGYLPPLPEELPSPAFTRIEEQAQVRLAPRMRERINKAAYLLVDGIERWQARPNVGRVEQRLMRLIKALQKAPVDRLGPELHRLLDCDEVGEALGSLLEPLVAPSSHVVILSPDIVRVRRQIWLADAQRLRGHLKQIYSNRRGAERLSFIDRFISRSAEIYTDLGLHPNASYNDVRGDRNTPFVRFVVAVAHQALRCFAPDVLLDDRPRSLRASFYASALEERVLKVVNPRAAEVATIRVERYRAKKRAENP